MKIISHRANLNGPDINRENQPWAIDECISLGYDVEIDLWVEANKLFLGHDKPEINISKHFMYSICKSAWIHAKNFEAVAWLSYPDYFSQSEYLNWFWHEKDKMTLTSRMIPWCYPDNYIQGGVTVVFQPKPIPVKLHGVCTDYPENWNKYK